ncbi:hypothetical protein EW145_g7340 [Phellinidium pouzarii]|uniref:Uncharacterized protein n=1 Tax=Phellinidium pouzarii TaxID=167371 RepID=A0A4S4KKL9_9AGAM|nr:hypothetical protein EW145_g7340 [Phellinidium pouzarii]
MEPVSSSSSATSSRTERAQCRQLPKPSRTPKEKPTINVKAQGKGHARVEEVESSADIEDGSSPTKRRRGDKQVHEVEN